MKVSITLSEQIVKELDKVSDKTGLSRSFLIRKCCEYCVKDKRCWLEVLEAIKE